MKTPLWILLAMMAVVLLFFTIGIIAPNQKLVNEFEVFASEKHCWNVYHDYDLVKMWVANLDRIDPMGEYQDIRVGHRYKYLFKDSASVVTTEVIQTFEEIDKPKSFSISYSTEYQKGTTSVQFKPTDLGTIITVQNSFTGKNAFYTSLFHFMKQNVQKTTSEQYRKLKKLIEETPISRYN